METQLLAVAAVPINKPKHVGWLIYRPDTGEFVCTHQLKPHLSTATYTKEAALAQCYYSEYLAVRVSSNIDQFTVVVPSFDDGEKIGIAIPDDYYGCVCIITKQSPSQSMQRIH